MQHHAFSQGSQLSNEGSFSFIKALVPQLTDGDGVAEWQASRANNPSTENAGGRGMGVRCTKFWSWGTPPNKWPGFFKNKQ